MRSDTQTQEYSIDVFASICMRIWTLTYSVWFTVAKDQFRPLVDMVKG